MSIAILSSEDGSVSNKLTQCFITAVCIIMLVIVTDAKKIAQTPKQEISKGITVDIELYARGDDFDNNMDSPLGIFYSVIL